MLERKVVLYIAMSLDGFIAKKDGDLSFLSLVEKECEDYGYAEFCKTVDAIIIGRKTYDSVKAMGFEYPHHDKDVFIISRTAKPKEGSFQYFNGSLEELVKELKSKQGKNIYCDGGAEIVNELLTLDLLDEIIVSIIPVLLGDGIPLFKSGKKELKLKLAGTKTFEKGLVQLHYMR